MGVWQSIRNLVRKKGLKVTIQYSFKKILGITEYERKIEKCEESIDTLFYFLNQFVDISNVPKAKGALRDLQECDIQLLRIFDIICRKNDWTYWLDYGTLLGAVRHRGFIPWDDDMDVAMPREVYEEVRVKMPAIMEQYGISVVEEKDEPMRRIGIGYKHRNTGIWIDVFPVDTCNSLEKVAGCREEVSNRILKYRSYYFKNKLKYSREDLSNKREEIVNTKKEGKYRISYHGPEFEYFKLLIHDETMIFPLTTAEFEGYSFYIPGRSREYLEGIYGSKYMQFPKSGVEHHGEENGKLCTWAEKSGTDMEKVYQELKKIADTLQ